MSKKLVVIVLDGMPKDLMDLLIKEDKIPNLKRFIDKNSLDELKSTIPPSSFPAWPVMLTGKNPAEIGCYDLFSKQGYSYNPKIYSHLKSIWDDLSDAGKTVGLINVPGTFPAKKINGFMISGGDTPSLNHNCTYPKNLKEELMEEFKDYTFYIKYNNEFDFIQKMIPVVKTRFKIIDKLYFKYQPDFFIFEEDTIDMVQHCFSKYIYQSHPHYKENDYKKIVYDYFKFFDSLIGNFLSKLDPNTKIMIISDHGSQPQKGKFFLNKLLEEKGFLNLKSLKSNLPISLKIMKKLNIDDEKVLYFLSKIKLKKIVSRVLAGTKLNRKMIRTGGGLSWNVAIERDLIDWEKTKAFSIATGFIYINKKNKEERGIISDEEYEEVRSQIIKELNDTKELELTVYKKEELYHGKDFENAPDIIVHEKSFQYVPTDLVKTNRFVIPLDKHAYHNGTHSLYGIITSNFHDMPRGGLYISYIGKKIREFFGIENNTEIKTIIEDIKL